MGYYNDQKDILFNILGRDNLCQFAQHELVKEGYWLQNKIAIIEKRKKKKKE